MTRITGTQIVKTPCCGAFVSTVAYGSINLMAYEYWTDGQNVGSLSPQDGGLRRCTCGQYYLLSECQHALTIPVRRQSQSTAKKESDNTWWSRLFHRKNREVVAQAESSERGQLSFPAALFVPEAELPTVIAKSVNNPDVLTAARRRYWRYLNDPFREIYRQHRQLNDQTFPRFEATDIQRTNILEFIRLLEYQPVDARVEVAELYRELGEFDAAKISLALSGRKNDKLYQVVADLLVAGVKCPARFRY